MPNNPCWHSNKTASNAAACCAFQEIDNQAESNDRSDREERRDRSANFDDGLDVIGNLERLLNNLRADRRKQRPVKVPFFSYFFSRPDLFLCIVETGVPVAACEPDHSDNKNGHH